MVMIKVLALVLPLASAFHAPSLVIMQKRPGNLLYRGSVAMEATPEGISRRDMGGIALAAVLATTTGSLPASARGRATQVAMWSRYGSRVEGMRSFIVGDLKGIINSGDFESLKSMTAPKGSIFSSYVGAMDLWAGTYSDSSPTPKTVAMQKDVQALRDVQVELQSIAKRALGEEVTKSGGLFGIGAKSDPVPSAAEAKKLVTDAQAAAINAYNDYCALNNEGHPFEVDELMEI